MKIKYIILLVVFTVSVFAENKGTPPGYEITKHTISSGGGQISGGVYSLVTSIGQIDAGHNASGSTYEFTGGFLAGATNTEDTIFTNGFE